MPLINDIDRLENFAFDESSNTARRFGSTTSSIFDTANQVGLSDRVDEARSDANAAFDTTEASLARRQAGLGVNLTERQRKSQKRQLGLTRAIAQDERTNSVREGFLQRARAAENASGSFEDGLFGIELGANTQQANVEGQRQIDERNERARKKAAKNSLIGQVVGTGLSLLALSSESAKDKQGKPSSLLKKLEGVRVDRWNYKGEDDVHIGPYAEEFNDAFDVGHANRGFINIVDALGVTMGALKELDAKVSAG